MRADTFGYIQRCWPEPSPVDTEEARAVGRYAAELAARGETSASVIIVRTSSRPTPIAANAPAPNLRRWRGARGMCRPSSSRANDVSAAFDAYCRPLVGDLPKLERL